MTNDEAKIIVTRMKENAELKAPPPNHIGHFPYLFGAFEEKIKWMLMMSKLKFKDFDETGSLKFPS